MKFYTIVKYVILVILGIVTGIIPIIAFIEAVKLCVRGIKHLQETKRKSKEKMRKKESKAEEVIY